MTTTTNKSLDQPAAGSANWDVPLNSNFSIIDAALGTLTYINVTGIGSTPVTLTASQYQKMGIVFTGTPSANLTYNLPSGVGGNWIIADSTTGGSSYTITLGSLGGGASIAIPRGKRSTVFSDGTSIIYSDDSRQGAPGSNTQVVYNSSGAFAASANFTFDGIDVSIYGSIILTTGSVFLSNSAPIAWGTSNIQAATNGDIVLVAAGNQRLRCGTASSTFYGELVINTGQLSMSSSQPIAWGTSNIQAATNGDVAIFTAGLEAARVLTSRNLIVGTSSIGSYANNSAIGAAAGFLCQGGVGGGFTANVFNINWTGSAAELWVDGSNLGAIYTASDHRIKKDVSAIGPALDRIKAIRPVSYKFKDAGIFKDDGVEREGFIAHELQAVIPSAVNGEKDAVNKDGDIAPQSLNLAPILSVAVKAMQEMAKQIEDIQAQINELKGAK